MPAAATPARTAVVDAAGHQLRADAAASYLRMLAAGMPAGGVDVFVRTMAQQQALYDAYRAGRGPIAAKPSPTAPHIDGRAMDLQTTRGGVYTPSAAHRWLTAGGDGSAKPKAGEKLRAHDYGWRRTVPSERWHFEYDRARDTKRAADLKARLAKLGYKDVKALQKAHGLAADGIDGPLTWAVLLGDPKPAPTPTPTPSPAPTVVSTLARVGTLNCGAWGKTSMTAKQIDALVDMIGRTKASILALTECPAWLRDHLRGDCPCKPGAHKAVGPASRWRVAIRVGHSQAILFDSHKWTYQAATKDEVEFGPTSYHGGMLVQFVRTTTKARVTVAAYHLPPNTVASSAYQIAALAKLIAKMPATGARVLAGDGADESGWAKGWDDSRTVAKKSITRDTPTYGKAIRDRIHVKGITVRGYIVVPHKGATDHNAVVAQIAIPAAPSPL